jgi:hypothetical protein
MLQSLAHRSYVAPAGRSLLFKCCFLNVHVIKVDRGPSHELGPPPGPARGAVDHLVGVARLFEGELVHRHRLEVEVEVLLRDEGVEGEDGIFLLTAQVRNPGSTGFLFFLLSPAVIDSRLETFLSLFF